MLDSNSYYEEEYGRQLDSDQELEDHQQELRDSINPWDFALFKKRKAVECLSLGETQFMSDSIATELKEFFEQYAKANPSEQKKLCDNLLMAMAEEAQDFYDDNETKDEYLEG